ncbi:MAG: hypothetical protein EXR67_03440 [Dehalococcoidia bacterium]|nr:hypothetical protein [Dehalococcoidia bacterium]
MPNVRPTPDHSYNGERHQHHIPAVIANPKSDTVYFEEMTRAVFQAGMDWGVIRARWPKFQKAFKRFDVTKVAYFSPDDVDYLLSAESGVIRNFRKVTATVQNAATFLEVREEFGSFKAYLRTFDAQPYALKVRDIKKRFRHVGDTGAFVFLHTVGEKTPPWADRKVTGRPQPLKPQPRGTRPVR